MPDPSTYRPASGTIPDTPGVYRFRDPSGRVIYVGKAKSLRQRLNSYFADVWTLHARTQQMVTTAAKVDWVTVGTEVEALQLEYNWIKEYDPRFNVRYRDDKSYPYLAVTLDEAYPRLQVMRGAKRRGVRYFGPYAHAWAIRETLDLLLRVFPARTCSSGVFKRAGQIGRPCLLGYIGKCSAPCVDRVSEDEHRQIVDDFCDFMAGKTDTMVRRLERDMFAASDELDFERAARIRDDLGALRRAVEKQAVVLGDGTDADVVAFADDPLEAAVQVFHVRGGRVRGQRGWVVEKTEDLSAGDLVHHFCSQIYGAEAGADPADLPKELLVPELPADVDALADWLSKLRGSRVAIRVPQRGDKKTLAETVARNAEQALQQHKLRRAGDLSTRSKALEEIAEALGMQTAPLRIECYDVSQIQGTDVVASMVVFEDGLSRKSEYRRFAVNGATDDVSALSEVLRRRFARYLDAKVEIDELAAADAADSAGDVDPSRPGIDPTTGRPRKFAYPPQLVVVDGGQPQVNAAAQVLLDLGIDDITICGLAKRLEEVWLPDDEFPVILPRASEGLYLLQRARDEAHRFAITYHRQKRSKRMIASTLDNVPGLGEIRRKALLRHFGSLKRLKAASIDEIAEVPGIGRRTADAILTALNGPPAPPAALPAQVLPTDRFPSPEGQASERSASASSASVGAASVSAVPAGAASAGAGPVGAASVGAGSGSPAAVVPGSEGLAANGGASRSGGTVKAPVAVADIGTPVVVIELMSGEAAAGESHPGDAEPGRADPAAATTRPAPSGPVGPEDAAGAIPGPAAPDTAATAPDGSGDDPEKVQTDRAARPADGTT
ncbi:excinuclease ABC subunit UvrC [Dactylosporangium siamense]|uniref:UvrABC system protein C n=1 Tax=Dactylosporangium siamense TaxID=685454 RepID=A0A919UF79_9ACTN|nr:UvrABC system protein C [Dactylosporangium siamense]